MQRLSVQFAVDPCDIRLRGPGTVLTLDLTPSKPTPVVTPVQFPQEVRKPVPPEPDLRPLLESISASIEEVEERRRQSLGEMQHVAIELAVAVASQLVFQALEREQFGVEELVRSAVEKMELDGPMTIALHPTDLALLQKRLAQNSSPAWQAKHVEFKGDAGVARGGCRAESPEGRMLISEITSRLSEIRRHWMEELDDAQIERRRTSRESPALRRFPDRRETA